MMLKDVMNRNVIVASPSSTLKEAATIMYKKHIGSLVIVENESIVGIITTSDIIKAVANGVDLENTKVEDVMSRNVTTIEDDKTVEVAFNLMMEKNIKRVPVTKDGKLVGLITASDIITVEPKLIQGIAKLISIKIPGYRGV